MPAKALQGNCLIFASRIHAMELSVIIPHIEALVFASEKPIPTMDLVELVNNALGFIEDRCTLDQVEAALQGIREKYSSEFYPFEVKESGGGWQFLTKSDFHNTIAQLNGDKFMKRLSSAALETLSIIAYKQPITKSEIEFIRGVNADYAVQKLLEKELIIIAGRKEDAPGHPLVYTTSKNFMDYFGINSPDELPKLSEISNTEIVLPTSLGQDTGLVEQDAQYEAAEISLPQETDSAAGLTEDNDLVSEEADAENNFAINHEEETGKQDEPSDSIEEGSEEQKEEDRS